VTREVEASYSDPLDEVWRCTAVAVGLRLERSKEVFAATDGEGTLTLGETATLDPDDCLGQMIFHELCHSLVQGAGSFGVPDWGLDNRSAGDELAEHACLRVQAALAGAYRLRWVLAPTTDFRAFYDALPVEPLAGDEPSAALAREAFERSTEPPWAPHLQRALEATRAIAQAVAPLAPADSLWARFEAD
jgi:hypothetical protein